MMILQTASGFVSKRSPWLGDAAPDQEPEPSSSRHDGFVAAQHAHAHALTHSLGQPLLSGNSVIPLPNDDIARTTILRAIDEAKSHINLAMHLDLADGGDNTLIQRLIACSRQGVRVNVLCLDTRVTPALLHHQRALRTAGVTVWDRHPFYRWTARLRRTLDLAEPRQLLVLDGKVGFVGAPPLGYLGSVVLGLTQPPAEEAPEPSAWMRGVCLRVEGPVVSELQRLFIERGESLSQQALMQGHYFPPLTPAGVYRVGIVSRTSSRGSAPFYRALLSAVDTAQKSIWLASPMLPHRRLTQSLLKAAHRGVDVHLLLLKAGRRWSLLQSNRSHQSLLERGGVKVHECRPSRPVTCLYVIDSVWAAPGAADLDWRNLFKVPASDMIVLDPDFAAQAEHMLEDLASACVQLTSSANARERGFSRG
jgi:cardiolipin synthase